MVFNATKVLVSNRGVAPDEFLTEIVQWAKNSDDSIFAVNSYFDIYSLVAPELGPWKGPLHRKAVMLEAMRVHAGFESSWKFNEGVDVTNNTSLTHITGEETGVFQVSFDSSYLGGPTQPLKSFLEEVGIGSDIQKFIDSMKSDHQLAIEYYARLVRVNIKWAGPLVRREINPWLSRASVAEFESLL
jgi:hypothetical protein